jgi:hypothetical protein
MIIFTIILYPEPNQDLHPVLFFDPDPLKQKISDLGGSGSWFVSVVPTVMAFRSCVSVAYGTPCRTLAGCRTFSMWQGSVLFMWCTILLILP